MATRAYYTAQSDPWGQMASGVDQLVGNLPRYQALATQSALTRAQTNKLNEGLDARSGVADIIQKAISNPEEFQRNIGALAQNYVQGGGDLKDLGQLVRGAYNVTPGATDAGRMNAALAAGQAVNEDSAFSPEMQNAIAARNSRLATGRDIAVQNAKPIEVSPGSKAFLPASHPLYGRSNGGVLEGSPTEGTVKGSALAAAPPAMQRAAAMAGVTPRNYRTMGGAAGITLDGVTDAASGAPVPQGANIFSTQAQPQADLFGKTMRGDLAEQQGAIKLLNSALNEYRSFTEDPTLFGTAGFVKRTSGDILANAEGVASLLSNGAGAGEAGALATGVKDAVKSIGLSEKDPRFAKMEALAPQIVTGVGALVEMSGRSMSNEDRRMLENALLDKGWASNAADARIKLDQTLKFIAEKYNVNLDLLSGKTPQVDFSAPPSPPPAEPAAKPDLIWDVGKGTWAAPGGG